MLNWFWSDPKRRQKHPTRDARAGTPRPAPSQTDRILVFSKRVLGRATKPDMKFKIPDPCLVECLAG
jgi:hypothetical protein